MLLHCADRFSKHDVRVGDTLKLPMRLPSPLGGRVDEPYRHGTFDVIALSVFGEHAATHPGNRPMAHCIVIRRRADGFTTTLAAHHWRRVREAYHGE